MYSTEIDELMKQHEYSIPSKTYFYICETSPQIDRVRYEPQNDYFEIWTNDNFYWRFTVYLSD